MPKSINNKKLLITAHSVIQELRSNTKLFVDVEYEYTWEDGEEKISFSSIPEITAIKAAAIDIRHFIANGSPITMGALIKCLRPVVGVDIAKLNQFYTRWGEMSGNRRTDYAPYGVSLNMDNEELSLREQIDLWMNGKLFHTSNGKTEKLERMYFSSFNAMSWMIFVCTLQDLTRLLFYFDEQFLQDQLQKTTTN